ncbi:unnamed protein product [Caenorhabditis auriculariae]|uniref:Uncharacterized protein n=1 Tax=Caenorhabditis auriculariae TaxID=2777116 RepID=A0A8S1HR17_9PELO|nr:unnamed protein product [Caenorhabditis auriculariae]
MNRELEVEDEEEQQLYSYSQLDRIEQIIAPVQGQGHTSTHEMYFRRYLVYAWTKLLHELEAMGTDDSMESPRTVGVVPVDLNAFEDVKEGRLQKEKAFDFIIDRFHSQFSDNYKIQETPVLEVSTEQIWDQPAVFIATGQINLYRTIEVAFDSIIDKIETGQTSYLDDLRFLLGPTAVDPRLDEDSRGRVCSAARRARFQTIRSIRAHLASKKTLREEDLYKSANFRKKIYLAKFFRIESHAHKIRRTIRRINRAQRRDNLPELIFDTDPVVPSL